MQSTSGNHAFRFWPWLHSTTLWKTLRAVPFLRSGLYLCIESLRALLEPWATRREIIDKDFVDKQDPWRYETNPLEAARFADQIRVLDDARAGRRFLNALEIGCAEGLFTQVLSSRCDSLLVLDLSPTAILRAQRRMSSAKNVRFAEFDLRLEQIPGQFDLIVLTGVLEYFNRPRTFRKVREKLAAALVPGGFLLIESTRVAGVIENSWWGRRLIRGRWINEFVAAHPFLSVVSARLTEEYAITFCRKFGPSR